MFLQMSVTGTVLIFFIILLRLFTLNKLPKKMFMLLWDIALLRLLLPVSLPIPRGIFAPAAKMADNGLHMFTAGQTLPSPVPAGRSGACFETVLSQAAFPWLSFLYLSGVILLLTVFAVSYLKERRNIQDALPLPKEIEADLRQIVSLPKRVRILISDRLSTPLAYGILSPRIVLSKIFAAAEQAQLRYVLTHELVHIKRADNLQKLLMYAAVCLHWFNPAVWIMYVLFNRDMELACDEKVIAILGEKIKKDYALTLVALAGHQRHPILFSTEFGKNAVKERIVAIMKYKKTTVFSIIIAALFLGTAITVFAQNETSGADNTLTESSSQTIEGGEDAMSNLYYSFTHSENFPEYTQFGLYFDVSANHLMYEGDIVTYFHDETAPQVYTHITDNVPEGIDSVGIVVTRNADYEILALEKVDMPDSADNITAENSAASADIPAASAEQLE